MAEFRPAERSFVLLILVVFLLLALAGKVAGLDEASAPVRIMVVTGGHAHDTSLCSLFKGYQDFAPMVLPRDIAFRKDLRSRWDVLVLYDLSIEISQAEQKNVANFLESGRGMVVLHDAIANYNSWAWWSQEVIGDRYLLEPDGTMQASTYDLRQEVVYYPVDHPITAGVGPLRLTDETYKGMWVSPRSKPILKTDHALSDAVGAWISPYEKSRVVVIQPGDDRRSHTHPGYRVLVRNAILWAARRIP